MSDAERLSAYLSASTDVRYRMSADWSEMHELVGQDFLASTGGTTDRWSIDYIHPDDQPRVRAAIDEAIRSKRMFELEHRVRRADGSWGWTVSRAVPILDAAGEIKEWFGAARDVTARKEAEATLREGEQRFRMLLEGIPQLVWRAVDRGRWSWASPQWIEFTGQAEQDSHGWGWLDMVHPDDREIARAAWDRAISIGSFNVEYRLRMIADGRYRWFATRATPVRNEAGEVVEWLGTSTDVDDLRQLQKQQQILLGELQHRVRNSLAVIRSIARRTAETSDSVEQLSMHLDGRLNTFSRIQSAVTSDPTRGLDLQTIVIDELMAHVAWDGEHSLVQGPAIRLQSKAAETLALAFHELASNAVEHGALSVPQGMVRVSWRVQAGHGGQDRLIIIWDEDRPGPPLPSPSHRGFGTDLLESTLAYELDADTSIEFRRGGLLCTITLPLTPDVSSQAGGEGRPQKEVNFPHGLR
ncbi:sensor histidine kinase [Sphingomonas ginkgonis]|nr:PAS domain-containing protein [Sphingomonas ginkgonis]